MDRDIKVLQNFITNGNYLKIYRDDENNIIIDGNVNIYDTEFTKFPVKIHKVNGTISWHGDTNGLHHGTLESLENFPDYVSGSVYIYKNPNLKSLKGCPKYIGGNLQCDRCNISDISDISEYIGNSCILSFNPIKDSTILEKIHIGNMLDVAETYINLQNVNIVKDSSLITKYLLD